MARDDEAARRLMTIPGIGTINATALAGRRRQRPGLRARPGHGGVARTDTAPNDDRR